MDGLHYLGCDTHVGFDYGSILQSAGGLASGIISSVEEDKAKEKLAADDEKKAQAAIAADLAASNAAARAETSAALKQPSAAVDASAAQTAAAAQDRAAADLSPSASEKRAAAADKALKDATASAQASPKDGYKAALVRAWTTTANKAHNVSIVSSEGGKGKKGDKSGGESWFTRRVVGPIPGYGVVVGGVGILGILGLVIKKVVSR